MKQVVLIGDSIRIGYQPFVEGALDGRLSVWGPEDNGGDSRNVLSRFDEWVIGRKPDVLHINCGLHDIKKEFGAGEAQVPFDEYVTNIETILARALAETDAKVIWAQTTPVNEEWHHDQKGFDRFEADVDAINRAATKICGKLGVQVNNLYHAIVEGGRDELLVDDGVHFRPEGSERLGDAVVAAILG